MTDKQFDQAGVSRLQGKFKVRWANGEGRDVHLIKVGHTDVFIVDMPHPMSKGEALLHLITSKFKADNEEIRACLLAEATKRKLVVPVQPEGAPDAETGEATTGEETGDAPEEAPEEGAGETNEEPGEETAAAPEEQPAAEATETPAAEEKPKRSRKKKEEAAA